MKKMNLKPKYSLIHYWEEDDLKAGEAKTRMRRDLASIRFAKTEDRGTTTSMIKACLENPVHNHQVSLPLRRPQLPNRVDQRPSTKKVGNTARRQIWAARGKARHTSIEKYREETDQKSLQDISKEVSFGISGSNLPVNTAGLKSGSPLPLQADSKLKKRRFHARKAKASLKEVNK